VELRRDAVIGVELADDGIPEFSGRVRCVGHSRVAPSDVVHRVIHRPAGRGMRSSGPLPALIDCGTP
jgi:hypothetical protein